jgi:hypothetical protein
VRRFAKFFTLPLAEQRDIVEAIVCLAIARLLLLVPFRWLEPVIGRPQARSDGPTGALGPHENAAACAVRRAILRVGGRLPWHSSCLVRALAAAIMLRRRRLPATLQLGVRGGSATELSAHAWLKCGEIDVVGAEIAAEFTPIAGFRA